MSSDLARWVPDLAAARAEGIRVDVGGLLGITMPRVPVLGGRDLVQDDARWSKLAALCVDARVQSRSLREVRTTVALRIAEQGGPIPDPELGTQAHRTIPNGPGERVRCDLCTYGGGRIACATCGGTGALDDTAPCRACHGERSVVCSRCEGHGVVWLGPVLEIDDRYATLRHVYAPPSVSLATQEAIASVIAEDATWPDALRVSLDPRVADPYRGTLAGHAIAGHRYDEAIPMARTAIAGLAREGEIVRADLVLHAWPFLFAREGDDEAAILVDAVGAIRCVRAPADG